MAQKYIECDIVEYDNKVMVVKEPRDGSHFDLSCPKEGLVYCFVDVDEIKPMLLTSAILKKNGWSKGQIYFRHSRIPRIKLCTDGGISWSVSIMMILWEVISIMFISCSISYLLLVLEKKWRCRYAYK